MCVCGCVSVRVSRLAFVTACVVCVSLHMGVWVSVRDCICRHLCPRLRLGLCVCCPAGILNSISATRGTQVPNPPNDGNVSTIWGSSQYPNPLVAARRSKCKLTPKGYRRSTICCSRTASLRSAGLTASSTCRTCAIAQHVRGNGLTTKSRPHDANGKKPTEVS